MSAVALCTQAGESGALGGPSAPPDTSRDWLHAGSAAFWHDAAGACALAACAASARARERTPRRDIGEAARKFKIFFFQIRARGVRR